MTQVRTGFLARSFVDFVVMVEDTSYMFLTGPKVVKAVTHEEVDTASLGGSAVHTTRSGVAHLAYSTEEDALGAIRDLLSFLPQNNLSGWNVLKPKC